MEHNVKRSLVWYGLAATMAVLLVLAAVACQGTAQAPPAPTTGTVSGTVTVAGGAPVAGAAVTADPPVKGLTVTTDAKGSYTAELPTGVYTLTFKKDGLTAATASVVAVAGQKSTRDVSMKADKPVAVSAGKAQEAAPGASVTLAAKADVFDGSQVTKYQWTQTAGPAAKIASPDAASTQVTLADAATAKALLLKWLAPEDRFGVLGINPHAAIDAATAAFKVTVTTSSGAYTGTTTVALKLPYEFSTGLQNVPTGVPVLLQGKKQNAYNWALTPAANSKAALDNPGDRYPIFTPDVVGKYTLVEKNSGATFNVYAGNWAGAITGQDAKGYPVAANCTACHNGKLASDNFTDWAKSGHAEIFTVNINTGDHYSESCLKCHTVGFNPGYKNGGFDDQADYQGFISADMFHKVTKSNWSTILSKFPQTASFANIQCDNCHGPTKDSPLHADGKLNPERVSIDSRVCGSCHGEPPRHGRFQQWEESGHGNFEPAIIEGTVENRAASAAHCGRCHTGQGFLKWTAQGDLTKQIQGAKGNATIDELKSWGLTVDSVQPITCAVCHDPHKLGNTSGEPNNVILRITGSTSVLPAGFKATEVGQGALCMTCHNTRNGLHNNSVAPTNYSAPHTASQADVLMGENAYFVATGSRSSHSYIKDTCATCHMEKTPAPANNSLNGAGTNHGFKADINICSQCHEGANGKALQAGIKELEHELGASMAAYFMKKVPAQFMVADYTPHAYNNRNYDLKSTPVSISKDNIASIESTEPHGQQGFLIKFKSPVSFTYNPAAGAGETHTVSAKEIQVQLGDFTTDGKAPVIAVTDPLVKAGWNFFLIEGDDSVGVHNPKWVREVLEASIAALK